MSSIPHIIADENIPGLEQLLGGKASISLLPGRQIKNSDLADGDTLLVRSITQVNESLIGDVNLSFVGSCTIGTDHIDQPFLASRNIPFANAPGCNANAVVDYVTAALFSVFVGLDVVKSKTVGICGLGEVGSRLKSRLEKIGVNVNAYDPYKADARDTFESILECDVLTLHVPLTHDGDYPTHHMINADVLGRLKNDCVIINTSRGPVIDNQALLEGFKDADWQIILDVFEEEPKPSVAILDMCRIATPHIAGYSEQGKLGGTQQVLNEVNKILSLNLPLADLLAGTRQPIDLGGVYSVYDLVCRLYDIEKDSQQFIDQYIAVDKAERAAVFDLYRKQYNVRTEFSYYDSHGLCDNGFDNEVSRGEIEGLVNMLGLG